VVKRSPMPDRRRPLSPGSKPLKRSQPTRRVAPLRRTRLGAATATVAARAADTGPPQRVRHLVYRRCGADIVRRRIVTPGLCEWPGCDQPRTDLHHRLNRKSGGRGGAMRVELNCASYLLGCCARHHRAVTSAVGEQLRLARAMGWVLAEGDDARLVPVLTRHALGLIVLDDAGGWEPWAPGE